MKKAILVTTSILVAGCTSQPSLSGALGTMKNPDRVMAAPLAAVNLGLDPNVAQSYSLLLCLPRKYNDWDINPYALSKEVRGQQDAASTINSICGSEKPEPDESLARRTYLFAGFDLADEYCAIYFEDADESQRRRKFGRALWNDLGTALSTVLGLANAGENWVAGAAAAAGLGDSSWRNYDDAFVVGPDLSAAYALVLTEQQLVRTKLYAEGAKMPETFYEAKGKIREYARHCTHLGMRSLLNRAAVKENTVQRESIDKLENPKEKPKNPAK